MLVRLAAISLTILLVATPASADSALEACEAKVTAITANIQTINEYTSLIRGLRDQGEQEIARLRARVMKLEADLKAAQPKPEEKK